MSQPSPVGAAYGHSYVELLPGRATASFCPTNLLIADLPSADAALAPDPIDVSDVIEGITRRGDRPERSRVRH